MAQSPFDLLRADPRVAAVAPWPASHEARQSVLVWPEPGWLAQQLSETGSAARRSLRGWETTYDLTYNSKAQVAANTEAPGATFVGWVSSFTAEQIPESDMRAWVAAIRARLLALPHRRVLDIGCGNGLLVEALAPSCEHYAGRDLSAAAIDRLSHWLGARPDLAHVAVEQAGADAPILDRDGYDLIIINSVCQYFPDAAYFERVLDAAWNALLPGGHVVVGDVRPMRLQDMLLSAVALAKAEPELQADRLRQTIHAAWLGQGELLVEPEFFDGFAARHGGSARILLKAGNSQCEMTRYRFDAILGKPDPAAAPPAPPAPHELGDLAALRDWIAAGADGVARLAGCANARLTRDARSRQLIREAPGEQPAGALRAVAAGLPPEGFNPGDLEAMAEAAGLACDIVPVRGDPEGRFDAWFGPAGSVPSPTMHGAPGLDLARHVSQPLLMQTLRRLATSLQATLSSQCSAAAMPALILPTLPDDAPYRAMRAPFADLVT